MKSLWHRVFLAIMIGLAITLCWQSPALAREAPASIQPYLDRAQAKVTEFRLANGMKFLVMERHQAPVVSFYTYADVGGVDEPEGKTGIAHFLEHLAFKGTSRIGTTNWEAEKALLEQQDQLYEKIRAAQGSQELQKLQEQFNALEAQASSYVESNKFAQIIEQAGGVGLNAATSADATFYFYSLPANKLELWMSLESERFLDPVFREFYKERDVILEEKRSRNDNSPFGRLFDSFQDKAFQVHPYRRPVIGYEQDIRNITRQDVKDFFAKYYVPSKLTVAIVGDVDPAQVKTLAQAYFGRYPSKPTPPQIQAIEPTQNTPREVSIEIPAQPIYLEGYHRPALNHPDSPVYAVIAKLMSDGRRSRLYSSLVEQQQIALGAAGFNSYPGDKFPHLLVFYALPARGVSLEQLQQALRQEINRLQETPVSDQELERVKKQIKAEVLSSLGSNMGMAGALVEAEVKLGSWRRLFTVIDEVEAVTAADIQRVAKATFVAPNRTVAKGIPKR